MDKKRFVVVGGAGIGNYSRIKKYLTPESDLYVFCDSGLKHAGALEVGADLIIGDFDSHEKPEKIADTIVLPCEKDDTDTVYAVKEGIKKGYDEFLLIGVIGQRLDHTLANVSALLMLHEAGKKALAVDDHSEISVVAQETLMIEDNCRYFSLVNIFGPAKGITIKNAKYPLEDAEIKCDYQYGVSNEVLPGQSAEVNVAEGRLLLIKVFDEGA